jgi:hypothetical protein
MAMPLSSVVDKSTSGGHENMPGIAPSVMPKYPNPSPVSSSSPPFSPPFSHPPKSYVEVEEVAILDAFGLPALLEMEYLHSRPLVRHLAQSGPREHLTFAWKQPSQDSRRRGWRGLEPERVIAMREGVMSRGHREVEGRALGCRW